MLVYNVLCALKFILSEFQAVSQGWTWEAGDVIQQPTKQKLSILKKMESDNFLEKILKKLYFGELYTNQKVSHQTE